ncbi:hypothetical protein F3Y22_tig00110020pilonHSYRG00411 [Hibiscus syriacus]|uniref:Uncharacterized protein n=1 Tax=Hibiscus syriacus TaxID=106335 RepID=A0A6A3BSM4_HIBSY|nr:hypothetical protein F3Y22_tig00110020pilonHSYRG00411 [Hibiscus syriacus]
MSLPVDTVTSIHCLIYIANGPKSFCPRCDKLTDGKFTFVHLPNKVEEGFVKDAVTYMITDDLVVRPIATNFIVALLNKLVLAESGKDFVDFLFNIMSLPENLSDSYMQSAANKEILLKPMVTNYAANVALLMPRLESSSYTNLYSGEAMSTESIVTLLNEFNIKAVGHQQFKVVGVRVNESKTALTDMFVEKKAGGSEVSNSGGSVMKEENSG